MVTNPATAVISEFATSAAVVANMGNTSSVNAPLYMISLPMKPKKSGNPAIDKAAAAVAKAVIGMGFKSPPR